MTDLPLLGQAAAPSLLSWMFTALGPFYALVLPLSGLLLFIGACLVVALSRRPAVIAAYLVWVPLPLLIGMAGSIRGFIASYATVAMSPTPPKPADVASGISTGLFCALVGLMVMIPSYVVVAAGLFLRTLFWRDEPRR